MRGESRTRAQKGQGPSAGPALHSHLLPPSLLSRCKINIAHEDARFCFPWFAAQARQFLFPLRKHGHAITPLGGGIKLAAVVHGDNRSLTLGAMFAGTVGKVGHVVPFQGADKAEVAGGDHPFEEQT